MQFRLRTLLILLAVFASFAVLPMVGAGIAILGKSATDALFDGITFERDDSPKPNPEVVRAPVSPN